MGGAPHAKTNVEPFNTMEPRLFGYWLIGERINSGQARHRCADGGHAVAIVIVLAG